MKNLSKKIGAGVVASSLILGGAVSTGLVANADSVKSYQVGQSQKEDEFDKLGQVMGDLETIGLAKEMFNFQVFGYYLESSDQREKMPKDVKELLESPEVQKNKNYQKLKDILDGKVQKKYDYAKDFLRDLCKDGMNKGIKNVRVGDAIVILVFNENVEPGKELDQEIVKKWKNLNLQVQVEQIEGRDHLKVVNKILELLNDDMFEQ